MSSMWKVTAGKGGYLIDEFRDKNVVAIGWKDLSSLEKITDRNKIIDLVQEMYPQYSKKKAIITGSQLYRFRKEIKINDRVITYDPSSRKYLVGTVVGEYAYDPTLIPDLPSYRKVKWEGEVSRDDLSTPTKNILGAIMTLFLISEDAVKEIESLLKSGPSIVPLILPEESETEDLLKDIQARSNEFIKDKVSKLDWDEMQELVAGLLRAMGYKTRISPSGPDRGKDIIASPDGFGLENPRIIVEVKHRVGKIGSQEIRSFLGGRHENDKGLFVSTGGFAKDALIEADRARIPLTLMDIDNLVAAIVEHYENMDTDTKIIIPLTKVYWPK